MNMQYDLVEVAKALCHKKGKEPDGVVYFALDKGNVLAKKNWMFHMQEAESLLLKNGIEYFTLRA